MKKLLCAIALIVLVCVLLGSAGAGLGTVDCSTGGATAAPAKFYFVDSLGSVLDTVTVNDADTNFNSISLSVREGTITNVRATFGAVQDLNCDGAFASFIWLGSANIDETFYVTVSGVTKGGPELMELEGETAVIRCEPSAALASVDVLFRIVDESGEVLQESEAEGVRLAACPIEVELGSWSIVTVKLDSGGTVSNIVESDGVYSFKWTGRLNTKNVITIVVQRRAQSVFLSDMDALRLLCLAGVRVDERTEIASVSMGGDELEASGGGFSGEVTVSGLSICLSDGSEVSIPDECVSLGEDGDTRKLTAAEKVCAVRFMRGDSLVHLRLYRAGAPLGALPVLTDEGFSGWSGELGPVSPDTAAADMELFAVYEIAGPDGEEDGETDGGADEEADDDDEEAPEGPVLELAEGGEEAYMSGRSAGVFAPEDGMTRAETAQMLYNCLTDTSRDSLAGSASGFWDLDPKAWYVNSVSALAGAGVLNGREDGSFDPDGGITRAEFVAVALRVMGVSGPSAADYFSDVSGSWARGEINLAARLGLIGGYPDGTFRPNAPVTRAEAARIMNFLLDRSGAHMPAPSASAWLDVPTDAWYYPEVVLATNIA